MFEIGQREIDAVTAVIQSGQLFRYRGGEAGETHQCELKINRRFGCNDSLVVTSGTAALICGLVGLGIGPGDEVIVPAYTWLASAGAVLNVGAIPVLADVDESLTLDPVDFEKRIGPRTKAVIPVHMAGHPCDMDRILAVAKEHKLAVLEDACQAIGGSYKGRNLATIGDAGAFSFNMFKIIGCGEGGALLTSDRKLFERALYHHDMGCTFRGHAGEITEEAFLGNNYRMNEILGAILRVQLERLDNILACLRERRNWILEAVREAGGPLKIAPSPDESGDCGTRAEFTFASAGEREKVAERAKAIHPACELGSPIHSGLHVYTNWTVLLEKRGGFHPSTNPFQRPENRECRGEITAESCPRTLDILARTGSISVGIKMTRPDCEALAGALVQAAGELL